MALHANPEVMRLVQSMGGSSFPVREVDECGAPCVQLATGLFRWGFVASMEIAAQMKGRTDFGRRSVGDWRLQGNYAPLREVIDADYVLFVALREIRETTGRVVGGLIGGFHTYFKQVGVACIVSLVEGRMIWCRAETDQPIDLRTRAGAHRLVRTLLSDMLSTPGNLSVAQHQGAASTSTEMRSGGSVRARYNDEE